MYSELLEPSELKHLGDIQPLELQELALLCRAMADSCRHPGCTMEGDGVCPECHVALACLLGYATSNTKQCLHAAMTDVPGGALHEAPGHWGCPWSYWDGGVKVSCKFHCLAHGLGCEHCSCLFENIQMYVLVFASGAMSMHLSWHIFASAGTARASLLINCADVQM